MNPNPFEYTIYIERPDQLLLWLMLLCLLGFLITGWAMTAMSRFFFYDASEGKEREENLRPFSILQLELPWSYNKFQNITQHMPEKTKDTVRMQLRLDYYFMPFVYLFLFFGGCFVLWCKNNGETALDRYSFLLWIPFIAWLFDIIENKLIASSLVRTTRGKTTALLFFSSIKWIIAILFFIIILVAYFVL